MASSCFMRLEDDTSPCPRAPDDVRRSDLPVDVWLRFLEIALARDLAAGAAAFVVAADFIAVAARVAAARCGRADLAAESDGADLRGAISAE